MIIVQTPNNVLKNTAKPVPIVNGKIRKLVKEMVLTLKQSDIGVGLAAPQVGISLRMFVASEKMPDSKNKENEPILVCINPIIISIGAGEKPKKNNTNKKN